MSERVSETKRVGAVVVTKHSIAGCESLVVYAAYEPSSYFGPHSTLYTIDGQVHGSIPSRRLPEEIEALKPGSPERLVACDANRRANEAEAYAAIVAAYPEAADGRRGMGEIELGSW